jgi:hypothetical protein
VSMCFGDDEKRNNVLSAFRVSSYAAVHCNSPGHIWLQGGYTRVVAVCVRPACVAYPYPPLASRPFRTRNASCSSSTPTNFPPSYAVLTTSFTHRSFQAQTDAIVNHLYHTGFQNGVSDSHVPFDVFHTLVIVVLTWTSSDRTMPTRY